MKFFFYFCNILIFSIITINCSQQDCYEYSCDECDSPDYGNCTKCRESFTLIDGKCPCSFSSCALCTTGFAALHVCEQCKDGYYTYLNDCYCTVNNCEQCAEDGCKKCITGYYYNETSKECIKNEEKINCYDPNCDECFSDEQGACESCNEGYYLKKGECINMTLPDDQNNCPGNYYLSGKYCIEKCSGAICNDKRYYGFFQVVYLCPGNDCLICESNELKIFSGCDNSEACSLLEGCLNCIDSEECLICQQGYYLVGGICKKCSEGCSICTSATNCEYCMSGYDLTSEKTCNLTYNFDYNTDLYEAYKINLIEEYYPEEISKYKTDTVITTNLSPTTTITSTDTIKNTSPVSSITSTDTIKNTSPVSSITSTDIETTKSEENLKITDKITSIISSEKVQNLDDIGGLIYCDKNCIECYQNKGVCKKCDTNYYLKDNKCKLICSDKNCQDCELKDGKEICNQCQEYYNLKSGKCELNCNIENCSGCSLGDNTLICDNCISGYYLEDNICKINCEDSNCKTCSDDGKTCYECISNYKLFEGKCAYNSEICQSKYHNCLYCIENIGCYECAEGYKINNMSCTKKTNFIRVIIAVIGALLIIIGLISFCYYSKKKRIQLEQMRERIQNNVSNNEVIYNIRNDLSGSFRSSINKEELGEEYEMQKRKMKKGKITCMFCKKKPGKFECDCGCIVCKDHSTLKEMQTEGQIYKVCFNCEKIVKKVNQIKYMCNICLQKKISVAHFKCNCALEVCKECYIKCKMNNNKCPGCRAII